MSNTPKKGTKKAKPQKKNSKRLSTEAVKKYEPLIQDRIAGMGIKELAEKHKLHRDTVNAICTEHKERIDAERAVYLAERQERINQAMDEDTESVVRLLGKSTRLLERLFDKINQMIDNTERGEGFLDAETLLGSFNGSIKAFDRVRASIIAQQKKADAE